ncbi:hypothetical protein RchiOBHm_Chr1g0331231 [Rosa chinensis]|uniref:Uncharacterized protein n=1 Tax=Rosa chinensis TaxID=74649 RepID=A0A2P6SBH7_ROSCH|nr:hypothetical protein RchiOBHm_Chr1g0331231 [Rosa chinensis]
MESEVRELAFFPYTDFQSETEYDFCVSQKPSFEPFRLFSSSGSGLFDQSEPPVPPPPPCVEVLPSQISQSVKYSVEPVELGGLTLLKGRVSTQDVFKLSNSDLVPGKYEAMGRFT